MFVRQSTYDAKCVESREWKYQYNRLADKWNDLVGRVNKAGGIPNGKSQFTQEEISRLILLCHPDKHDGKTMAVEITQKLLKMRK